MKISLTQKNTERNKIEVDLIKSAITYLKNTMFEDEKRIEQPDKIVDIVKKILGFNEKYQEGQRLKIPTPNQMLSRLPISLAKLKAGNNSENLKMK